MLEPVSVGLKFGFLVVLYLFLLWVAWSSLRDLRGRGGGRGRRGAAGRHDPVQYTDATGMYSASLPLAEFDGANARLLVERAPGHEPGTAYEIPGHGATLGRGDVEIQLEDPFASSRHARITRQGQVLVIEDLGSTNGTYLNDEPLTGPQPLHRGDRIRIGDSEFSFVQMTDMPVN
ncbi:MAG: FHA domain-containing protein [Solirubrobacterales bacterium]|nr:FHA domain-containing protein [Solirubrobacterales bacterium]MBV9799331.1 FHA domain-containing protein [Solirubrobacterales bacterium]